MIRRVTISVPADLMESIETLRGETEINVSSICTDALRTFVARMRNRRSNMLVNIDDERLEAARRRLRQAATEEDKQKVRSAREIAESWVLDFAEPWQITKMRADAAARPPQPPKVRLGNVFTEADFEWFENIRQGYDFDPAFVPGDALWDASFLEHAIKVSDLVQ